MEERFEVYKKEVVAKFYETYFRNYGRQIVLVDVLGALLAGREAFEDTRLATEAILESFRYGQHNILSKLIGSARVEKVLFAATKADHIPDMQRDHMSALLRNMAALPVLEARGNNADIDVTTLASVASTVEAHAGDRRPARRRGGRASGRRSAGSRNSSAARCRSGRRVRMPGASRFSIFRCSSRP